MHDGGELLDLHLLTEAWKLLMQFLRQLPEVPIFPAAMCPTAHMLLHRLTQGGDGLYLRRRSVICGT